MKIFDAKNNSLSLQEISEIVDVLKNGGVMVYPTETVYGLGCNVFDENALKKIFDLKGRKETSIVSVMVKDVEEIANLADVGEIEKHFLNKYLPGPVTVILNLKKQANRDRIFSTRTINIDGGIGLRVAPKEYMYIAEIIDQCGFPIITTSANKTGVGVRYSNVEYVVEQFSDKLDMIDIVIDAGDLGNISPSTVVDLTKTPFSIVRWGMEKVNINDLKK